MRIGAPGMSKASPLCYQHAYFTPVIGERSLVSMRFFGDVLVRSGDNSPRAPA